MSAEPLDPSVALDQPLTEEEIRAFVGRKADYYVEQWIRRDSMGANWAAFFLSGIWFPYRRMYRVTLIFFAAILADSVIEEVIDFPRQLSRLLAVVVAGICCSFANRWYFHHATSKIREVRAQGLPAERYLDAVASRGGTSLFAGLGLFALLLMAVIAAVMATALALGKVE
ncbi:MAG TPA: DUF2628 domain-containing protein [Planctomycetaceae bacterium]|jgi:hypothetical protein|nr:DUF2628 domain-containing protein [Planctomycetaceae bacterium]